jgi:hypothetical protein
MEEFQTDGCRDFIHSGPRTSSRPSGSAAWCSTATRRTSSPRTSRSRSAPACSWKGSTAPTTRCASGGRSPTATRSATAWGPTSITGGLREAEYPTHDEQGPVIEGLLTRKRIPRTSDYQQAGERYLLSEQWEKDDLVANLTGLPAQCDRPIPERMVWHLYMCEDELGQRVGDGIGISADDVCGLPPLQSRTLTEAELERAPTRDRRDVMTHCVPNERVAIAADEDLVGTA